MSYGGSPDFSYGIHGFAAYQFTRPADAIRVEASVAQQDGKVVVVGALTYKTSPTSNPIQALTAARYNVDGTLDTAFGAGGYFTDPALAVEQVGFGPQGATAQAVAVQPDGKIVIVGLANAAARLVRLDADGTLDTAFGTGGIVTLGTFRSDDGILDRANAVRILPDAKIVVGGVMTRNLVDVFYNIFPVVAQFNADGSIDAAYGKAGLVVYALPTTLNGLSGLSALDLKAMIAQPDGKLVLLGSTTATFSEEAIYLARLDPDGTLDPTFGTGGSQVVTAGSIIPFSQFLEGKALAIQPDGKLVVGGSFSIYEVVALRFQTNGTLDDTFGIKGVDIVIPPPSEPLTPPYTDLTFNALAIQPDGKILLAGGPFQTITRLDRNGLPDHSFGLGGTAILPSTYLYSNSSLPTVSNFVGVSVLADGRIVAAMEGAFNSGLYRLLPNGAVGDYDEDGRSDPAILLTAQAIFAAQASGEGSTGEFVQFGTAGAGNTIPAPGAYNGGGVSELGVYLPALGAFAVRPFDGSKDVITPFGTPGLGNSIPTPGDYIGSGRTQYAVYLPNLGIFAFRPFPGTTQIDAYVALGIAGAGKSIPVPADYFGSRQTDLAVYLVDQGAYQIRNSFTKQVVTIPFGTPGAGKSIPVPGDYDGSGFDELAVYLPDSGILIYRPFAGGADVIIPFGVPGTGLTLPAPGDYDGSGKTEVAAYFPTLGVFGYRPAKGGTDVFEQFGIPNKTIPFTRASATVEGPPGFAPSARAESASIEIPLTPDVLDWLSGTSPRKPNQPA